MSTFSQYFLSGLAMGGVYALIALGFHVMWSSAKAVNFAHGDTLMLGALLALLFFRVGMPMPLAVLLAIAVSTVFGVLLERLAVRPFASDSGSIGWMLSTIAIGIMIESAATIATSGYSLPFPSPLAERAINVLGAGIYPQELLIPAVAIGAMVCLHLMQRHTLIGRAMRAIAHNKSGAALMGINVNRIVAFSFGLAALTGALAGILIAPITQASATMGVLLGLKGFAVAIIGGITSAGGVVAAGLAFGVMEKFVEGYGSTALREIFGFGAMVVILLVFPQGLFGRKEIKKV